MTNCLNIFDMLYATADVRCYINYKKIVFNKNNCIYYFENERD